MGVSPGEFRHLGAVTGPGRGDSCSQVGLLRPSSTGTWLHTQDASPGLSPPSSSWGNQPHASAFRIPPPFWAGTAALPCCGWLPVLRAPLGIPRQTGCQCGQKLLQEQPAQGSLQPGDFFQTGLAEPGHGPQWVLWARTRGPGPTAHAGGLADAPGRTGPPDVVPGSSAGLRAQSQNQQLL